MSWLQKLCETYDEAMKLDISEKPLPLGHISQTAHICVALDSAGNFKSARTMREKEYITIPATEDSAARTSNPESHPLADKLKLIFEQDFVQKLENWCTSPYKNPQAQVVLAYLKKGSLMDDLVRAKVIHLDENGALLKKWPDKNKPEIFKLVASDQESALVCWEVYIDGEAISETWKNISVFESWAQYRSAQEGEEREKGFCYVLGADAVLMQKHPRNIRRAGDGARLISSNDGSGFTFRGRFETNDEPVGLSSEASQKAHAALSWLIRRNSFRNGDQVFIAWAVNGKELPELFNEEELDLEADVDLKDEYEHKNVGAHASEQMRKHLSGYRQKFEAKDQIIVMGVDSASPGRLSISYYQEYLSDDFFDTIESWYDDFEWWQRIPKKYGGGWRTGTPAPRTIAKALYGESRGSLRGEIIKRLLPCILEKVPVPVDIMRTAVQKAANPHNCEYWEWERNISIACAIYRGFIKRSENKEHKMSLETENNSRDYLYGRLLAVAERIEYYALGDVKRATNAERYIQQFSLKPYSTWPVIYKSLEPHIRRLKSSAKNMDQGFIRNREKELMEINNLFDSKDFKDNSKLSGEFLLGYFSQKYNDQLNNKSKENENEPESQD